ncbi:putative enzyme related to lactoylglutathione lyase [Nocardia transvalensis]|uniref:Putative enzyme related to lactoylglutathione lyase n=1 Tax=Nocardia transvalensis TaxID=37333 RepID=A0A7W9UKI8_9NOCA|nr:glyoxalase/bleomycin resistance/dioxygenase family protein [Nocardia transvalensis]MBB5916534.1 putative enzyme related to lactoylglutathione lyase [Nocardia transvalensis]
MRILKTYARLFVTDLDTALPVYETLVGAAADLRFGFERAELAAVGDFLLIAGPPDAVDGYRTTAGPVVVDDLAELIAVLTAAGAELTGGPLRSATGEFAYLRHPDGAHVEYVQWADEVRERVLG